MQLLSILLTTLLAQVLGAVWYSALFGRAWVAAVYPGKRMSDLAKEGHNPILYAGAMVSAGVNSLLADALLRHFAPASLAAALQIAAVMALANLATTIPHYGFKGFGVRVYVIEMLHDSVALAMIYGVQFLLL
jgi:polyferredoxin|eukprot:TRINITY_DN3505_c0_g3_i1.p2 TRINITY_DN3505_c0_g3~~TRINITY_DN3505_c0_g3_i1.p2  ORF type:complete len:140 (+),score=56.83 TRINITY_DN3505_c0_g3_i1:22-420(+)